MNGFEILKKIGNGSFSSVYKVRRKQDNNIYALKKVKLLKLKEKEKQAALNEVRILASIKSPFIISYKEAFIEESDKSLCIVMEYADDGDLYQKICQYKKMNLFMEESDIWRVFIQMVKGLKILHDLKILHRDLKSANILLFNDGTAKIGDCNVSKIFYGGDMGVGYTQTGTPYYASPEVWNNDPYDKKSDIWSLGIITYEMLNLTPPFKAGNMEALYKKIMKGQYGRINSRYSRDIANIVNSILLVEPKERPSCDEILKNEMVKERIDFFSDREGFNDDEDNNNETLMKSLRLSKNMRFISQQLPNPNYNSPKNEEKNKNKSDKLKQNNISLPNINKSLHYNNNTNNVNYNTKNELKIDSPKKSTFNRYNLIYKTKTETKRDFSNDKNNKSHKNLSMETDIPILSYTKDNYKKFMKNKETEKSNNNDSININNKNINDTKLKTKSLGKIKEKDLNSKYKKELSLMNIYPEYEATSTKRNNRYNLYSNRYNNNSNYYLPNIYKNQISSSKRRTRLKSKK